MSEPRHRSPLVAAALSFVFPGLGEIASGDRRRGLLFAIPGLVVLLAILLVGARALADGGRAGLVDLLVRRDVLTGIVVVDLLLLAYRFVAIIDAWVIARQTSRPSGRAGTFAVAGLVALLAVTGLSHAAVASVGIEANDALSASTVDNLGPEWAIPDVSFTPDDTPTPSTGSPGSGTAAPTPSPTPSPTPVPTAGPVWARDGRLNLLLVGSDAGTGRWLLRTDTMLVLSVDIASGRAALFGIPRNLTYAPLPAESRNAFPNGRFPDLLNALYVYAWEHPNQFPGGDARGFRAITGAVQELVGVKLDAFAAVDLRGFVQIINALGGMWLDVPERIVDDAYPPVGGGRSIHLEIKAGCQKMDGDTALAFARSRHQDSDYGRMGRQQTFLLALRHQIDPLSLVARAPELLDIARDHLWTTLTRQDIGSLAELMSRVDAEHVQKFMFVPPAITSPLSSAEMRQIRQTVRTVFEKPAPKPTAKPSVKASASGSPAPTPASCPP